MRRLLIEEPVSRAALWSRRVAVFAWLSLGVALLLARLGRLEPYETLAAFGACAGLAVLAAGLAVLGFAAGWNRGAHGMRSALFGLVLALALVAYPAGLCLRDLISPRPLDLTTDIDDPPAPLDPLPQLAGDSDQPVVASMLDAGIAKAIEPQLVDLPINDALGLALRAAGASGWHVTTVAYPTAPSFEEASFSATVPSFLIRWPSDAVVRLSDTEDGIRVDVRLIAREPWSLLHNGNTDISAYLDRIDTLASGKQPHAGR